MKKLIVILSIIAIFAMISYTTIYFVALDRVETASSVTDMEEEDPSDGLPQSGKVDTLKVSGVVLDGITKQPLTAKVMVKKDDNILQSVDCNENGEYILYINDEALDLSAEYQGYVAQGKNDITHSIKSDGDAEAMMNIMLWPEAHVKGRIVSDNHAGVTAELQFIYQQDASQAHDYHFKTIETDDHGYFMLDEAFAGIQKIEIVADGYISQTLTDIQVDWGKTIDLGDIPMMPGITVQGVITDALTQQPISDATLKLIDKNKKVLKQTKSQADGSYTFPPFDIQNIQISVSAKNYVTHLAQLSPQGQMRYAYDVALAPRTGLGLTINNQTGREPLSTFVTVTDISSNKVVYEHTYEENGYDYLEELKNGPYLVRAVSYDKKTEYESRAMGGNTVMLTLKPFARLNVQFVMDNDKTDAPVTYRYLYKPDSGDAQFTEWTPCSDDVMMIENLMPGTYQIEAHADGTEVTKSREVHLDMGDTHFVRLDLSHAKQDTTPEENVAQARGLDEAASKELFDSIEEVYQDFMSYTIWSSDSEALQEGMVWMGNQMHSIVGQYSKLISETTSPEWRVAALSNMGSVFNHVADVLNNAPIPEGLPEDIAQQYQQTVQEFAGNFIEKGNSYHSAAVRLSEENHIQTSYTEKAKQALQP